MFSLTRNISETSSLASHLASSIISVGRRETNEPLNMGIAQKEHLRSHPDAIFSDAIGVFSRRFLNLVSCTTADWRSAGARGNKVRRSFGVWAWIEPPAIIVRSRLEISL